MRRTSYYMLALMLMISVSCTRKSDVVLPPHTPKLVLHSYVAAGELFHATLGKTIRMDVWVEDTATFITNGWMALFENGVLIDSLRYDSASQRYLASTAVAEAGKTYRLVAGADGFTTVDATSRSPLPVGTVSISHIVNARTDVAGSPLDDVTFSFNDPASEQNYYLASLYPAFPGMTYTCVYTYDPAIEKYTEGLLPFDQNSCISSYEILYTDKSFNGKLKEITLSSNSYSLQPYTDPITGDVLRPYLKRYSISADYYRYFKNTNTIALNSGGPTLSDPIIIKGNVNNGYGIFTLFTSVTDTLP